MLVSAISRTGNSTDGKKGCRPVEKRLDPTGEFRQNAHMKQLIRLTIMLCACAGLALTVVAGPEPMPSGKEMKQVAPAALPECNLTGIYVCPPRGGQRGQSEDLAPDRSSTFEPG